MNNKINLEQVTDLILDDNIKESLNNIASLDYVESVSVSRDIHFCNDIPVGTKVVASRFNAKWVGADIGCGVSVINLPQGTIDKLNIEYLQNELNTGDYTSFNLGTIGGGNHFVEFGYDSKQNEYVTIHTGSRTHGGMIAEIIQEFNLDDDLKLKLHDKSIEFAKLNHKMLLKKILPNLDRKFKVTTFHHNYAIKENGKFIHFKGSLVANKGKGFYPIPANMKDGVFMIVAMEDNLHIPHGAGRQLRRRDALYNYKDTDIESQTNHLKNEIMFKNRDELPSVYKNINEVINPLIENNKIKLINNIKPIICIKG